MRAVQVAGQKVAGRIHSVAATDPTRSAFAVTTHAGLHLVAGDDLTVLRTWRVTTETSAVHAIRPDPPAALVSGPDRVEMLDGSGARLWTTEHEVWSGDFESGCSWFDLHGQALAIVPCDGYVGGCRIVRLDLGSGAVTAESVVDAAPAGVHPIHHLGGWVGLAVGEGQDRAHAFWVRRAPAARELELIRSGWDHEILGDVDAAGRHVLTVPHMRRGPIDVRAFPSLETVREIPLPSPDRFWAESLFVGEYVVGSMLGGDDQTVAVAPNGAVSLLDLPSPWIVPAAGSFLVVDGEHLSRWTLDP